MIGPRVALAAALLFATAGSPALAQPKFDEPREAIDLLIKATAEGDAAAMAAAYAPEAILLVPGRPVASGRDAIRAAFENDFREGASTLTAGSVRTERGSDRAVVFWTWIAEVTPAAGAPMRQHGRSLVYFSRTSEGGWLISADMRQPAPEPPQ